MSAVLADPPLPALVFKPIAERDIAQVARIEEDVYVFPWSPGNFRDSLLSGYQCWGCWMDDELIGYAVVMNALDEAHLLNLAVASRWQRQGVGANFLTFLISEARKLDKEMIYLEVRLSNIAGRRLYEQFGFTQLGLRRAYYPAVAGREDALFLGLNIAARKI
ncbi:MAG TPA: ribosomal protein S18-alanine N-acetyltransferase [Usitatibacteraceae bacterium]